MFITSSVSLGASLPVSTTSFLSILILSTLLEREYVYVTNKPKINIIKAEINKRTLFFFKILLI